MAQNFWLMTPCGEQLCELRLSHSHQRAQMTNKSLQPWLQPCCRILESAFLKAWAENRNSRVAAYNQKHPNVTPHDGDNRYLNKFGLTGLVVPDSCEILWGLKNMLAWIKTLLSLCCCAIILTRLPGGAAENDGIVTNASVMWSELSKLGELFDWILLLVFLRFKTNIVLMLWVCFVLFAPQKYHHPPITLSCKQSALDAVGERCC